MVGATAGLALAFGAAGPYRYISSLPLLRSFRVPERFLFSSTDFNSYLTVSIADGAPQRVRGRLSASLAPGLGVMPIATVLGTPVFATEGARQKAPRTAGAQR